MTHHLIRRDQNIIIIKIHFVGSLFLRNKFEDSRTVHVAKQLNLPEPLPDGEIINAQDQGSLAHSAKSEDSNEGLACAAGKDNDSRASAAFAEDSVYGAFLVRSDFYDAFDLDVDVGGFVHFELVLLAEHVFVFGHVFAAFSDDVDLVAFYFESEVLLLGNVGGHSGVQDVEASFEERGELRV